MSLDRMSLAIERHNFEPNPFERSNIRAADASLDDGHAPPHPTNDYCIDRFAAHQGLAADAPVAIDADFALVDVANVLAVALTFVEFVDLFY